jgi:hypothetical protein
MACKSSAFPRSTTQEIPLKLTFFDRIALLLVVVFLGLIAARPFVTPQTAQAESPGVHYYIEPGIKTILAPDRTKQVKGKVVVDLTNGEIWGFQTSPDVPYPIDTVRPQAATSSPIYLGKFDFAAMHRAD